jgi:hypothetical protein
VSEAAPAELQAALASSLGALLADDDAFALQVVAGARVAVTRRGRRELLELDTDELEVALLEAGLDDGPLSFTLDGGATLAAARLADGRWALSITRRGLRPSSVAAMIESGLLPASEASRLMEAVLAGRSVLVGGPCRWGAQALVAALAEQAGQAMSGMVLADAGLGALPPAPPGSTIERTRLAASLGAAFILVDGLSRDEIEALDDEDVIVIGTTRISLAALEAHDGRELVVIGFAPDGAPELKAASPSASLLAPPTAAVPVMPAPAASARRVVAALTPAPAALRQPPAAVLEDGGDELPPLKPLPPGPPTEWAVPDDEGPGWELDDDGLPPAFDGFPGELGADDEDGGGGAAFESILKGNGEGNARPTFTPRPPVEHPQTRQLKTDPLGGMTLEPPGSNPRGDE